MARKPPGGWDEGIIIVVVVVIVDMSMKHEHDYTADDYFE